MKKWEEAGAEEHRGRQTGKLTEAARYALQQWVYVVYVRRCFEDGRLEIDNGACERAIRGRPAARRLP